MGRLGRDATGHDQIPWMGCRRDEHVHHWRRMSRTIHRHERHPLPSLSQPGWIRSRSTGFFFPMFHCFLYLLYPLYLDIPFAFFSLIPACVRFGSYAFFWLPKGRLYIPLSLVFFLSSSPFFFLLQLVQSMVPYPSGIRQKHLCGR